VPFRSVLYLVDRSSLPLIPDAPLSTSAAVHAFMQHKAAAYALDVTTPATTRSS
jgi:hypothetical protein